MRCKSQAQSYLPTPDSGLPHPRAFRILPLGEDTLCRNEAAKGRQKTVSDPFGLPCPIQFFDGFFAPGHRRVKRGPAHAGGWSIGGVLGVGDGTKHGLRAVAEISPETGPRRAGSLGNSPLKT